jgi:peptidoglycan/xylan/chitin deacetylase (PgdA/CDA1 family)
MVQGLMSKVFPSLMTFPALMYHSLSDGKWPDTYAPKYTVSLSRFEETMRYLRDSGYTVRGCDDLIKRLEAGTDIPPRYCLMTIDDGHKSGIEMADAMKRYGFSATYFLTMDYCVNRADFLKPDDIRRLCAEGFDMGSHGRSHRSLGDMSITAMRAEIESSKKWLEDITGKSATAMSLPGGQGVWRARNAAFEAGFRLLCTSREAMNSVSSLPAEIARFAVLHDYDLNRIRVLLEGRASWIIWRRLRAMLLYLPKKLLRAADRTR